MRRLALGLLVFSGCYTPIHPVVKAEATRPVRLASGECSVMDYPTATEVPPGSQSLGWVKVARQATDEETFEKLRAEVCAKGGNAMSQMHWLRASGASVADPPVELEGHAWLTPSR